MNYLSHITATSHRFTSYHPHPSPMPHSRGRSREVSRVALARKASADRKAARQLKFQHRTPSASPSPPTTPVDLSDQIFVAYAHEDFHLAKKLLLRLKGIQVAGDDDPLIDTVKDEDFDYCFMPNGRVMSDTSPRPDTYSIERRRADEERKKKKERLRRCQFIWEKQDQEQEDDWFRRQTARMSGRRKHPNYYHKRGRSLILFNTFPNASPEDDSSVLYDGTQVQSYESPSLLRPAVHITFNDVLSSMEGPLFPYDSSEQRHYHTHTRSESRGSPHTLRKRQLLHSLLHSIDDDKDKLPVPLEFKPVSRLAIRSPASSTSSVISRANSWLSFRANSASSASTAITTPSSSPPSKSALLSLSSLSWVKSKSRKPISTQPPRPSVTLVSVPLHTTPLGGIPQPEPSPSVKGKGRGQGDGVDIGGGRASAQRVVKQVKKLVSLATAFQTAYMSIAAYSIPCDIDRASLDGIYGGSRLGYGYHGTGPTALRRTESTRAMYYEVQKRPRLNGGHRVKRSDVRIFLSSDKVDNEDDEDTRSQSIQLASASAHPPRTVLPSPLPYSIVFKPLAPLPSSPLRQRGRSSSPSTLAPRSKQPVWRLRPVSNPAALRLKALSNVLAARGCAWEGRGDPSMQCGAQEKMLGVAIEGGCRSVLSL